MPTDTTPGTRCLPASIDNHCSSSSSSAIPCCHGAGVRPHQVGALENIKEDHVWLADMLLEPNLYHEWWCVAHGVALSSTWSGAECCRCASPRKLAPMTLPRAFSQTHVSCSTPLQQSHLTCCTCTGVCEVSHSKDQDCQPSRSLFITKKPYVQHPQNACCPPHCSTPTRQTHSAHGVS